MTFDSNQRPKIKFSGMQEYLASIDGNRPLKDVLSGYAGTYKLDCRLGRTVLIFCDETFANAVNDAMWEGKAQERGIAAFGPNRKVSLA